MNEKNRYGGIDLLRFMMAFFIVFHHYQQLTGLRLHIINFWNGRFYWGRLVECFFLISGMMAGYSLPKLREKDFSVIGYLRRKAMRLLPLPAVSVLVYELLNVVYKVLNAEFTWVLPTTLDLKGMLISFMGMQSWGLWKDPMINNPIWYISILWLCQIVFGILVRLIKDNRWLYGCCLAIVVGFAQYRLRHFGVGIHADHVVTGMYSFFFGIILGVMLMRVSISDVSGLICICVAAAYIFTYLHGVYFLVRYEIAFMTYLVFPCILILMQCPMMQRCFNNRKIRCLGELSFDIYVWHIPVLYVIFLFNDRMNGLFPVGRRRGMAAFTLIVLIAAVISYLMRRKIDNKIHETRKRRLDNGE